MLAKGKKQNDDCGNIIVTKIHYVFKHLNLKEVRVDCGRPEEEKKKRKRKEKRRTDHLTMSYRAG